MKQCIKCKESKPFTEFNKKNSSSDGLNSSCKSCRKLYRDQNKDHIREKAKKYREENREYYVEYSRKWRENNDTKEYYEKNKKSILESKKKYIKKRKKEDSLFRAISNLRSRLYIFCKHSSIDKRFKTMDSVDLTPVEFKLYIESLFVEGMTWDNYGKGQDRWAIDHIKPLRMAKTIDEAYMLNHYTNLQPMWNPENFAKGGKFESNY